MSWKQSFAEWTYSLLDPVYGEGGILEPVAVAIDPDRDVYGVYIEPRVETLIDYGTGAYKETKEVSEKAVLYGAGVLALYLLLR